MSTNIILFFASLRISKTSRQSCRSPVFARRLPQDQTIIDNDNDSRSSHCDSSIPSMALTSLDTNGIFPIDTNHSSINHNKRSLESTSSEQVLIKRRYQKSVPSKFIFLFKDLNKISIRLFFIAILTQRNYCISYPTNIPRCVDCQTASVNDFSMHLAGCRFQHCRT